METSKTLRDELANSTSRPALATSVAGELGLIPEALVFQALGIESPTSQWRARKSGALPPTIKVGRNRFVRLSTWAKWLEAMERGEEFRPAPKPGRGRPRKPVDPLAPLNEGR